MDERVAIGLECGVATTAMTLVGRCLIECWQRRKEKKANRRDLIELFGEEQKRIGEWFLKDKTSAYAYCDPLRLKAHTELLRSGVLSRKKDVTQIDALLNFKVAVDTYNDIALAMNVSATLLDTGRRRQMYEELAGRHAEVLAAGTKAKLALNQGLKVRWYERCWFGLKRRLKRRG